jgi:hypothetical protein
MAATAPKKTTMPLTCANAMGQNQGMRGSNAASRSSALAGWVDGGKVEEEVGDEEEDGGGKDPEDDEGEGEEPVCFLLFVSQVRSVGTRFRSASHAKEGMPYRLHSACARMTAGRLEV